MFDFLKKIIESRRQKVTFVLWEEGSLDEPKSYSFLPKNLIRLFISITFLLIIVFLLTLRFTPFGNLLLSQHDPILRDELLLIGERIVALQDSLIVRDEQLQNMKEILRRSPDTTFAVGRVRGQMLDFNSDARNSPTQLSRDVDYSFLKSPDIQFNVIGYTSQVLPAPFPLNGTVTQGYSPINGHFGIDIATMSGTTIRTIAEGVVISTEWTMNYGNVVYIQHKNGYLTIFKHVSKPTRKVGDFVQKGDILGSVTESGLISSGPHLHFEIWQNGTPLNPLNYLIN